MRDLADNSATRYANPVILARAKELRPEWLERRGLRVIRFTNRDINADIEGVLQEIARQCGIHADPPPGGGSYCSAGTPALMALAAAAARV